MPLFDLKLRFDFLIQASVITHHDAEASASTGQSIFNTSTMFDHDPLAIDHDNPAMGFVVIFIAAHWHDAFQS